MQSPHVVVQRGGVRIFGQLGLEVPDQARNRDVFNVGIREIGVRPRHQDQSHQNNGPVNAAGDGPTNGPRHAASSMHGSRRLESPVGHAAKTASSRRRQPIHSRVPMSNSPQPATRWSDLGAEQRKAGLAAWLGWMFDGMDMHLYTLVATPFVAQLMHLPVSDPSVAKHGAIINGAFLVGWATGGAFFGRIGDVIGRSRALCLTILAYAAFTGLSALSGAWWHLMLFRFLSALGIGGEWAVGASLLSETWPRAWRPWIAAGLQSAVNIGVLFACLAGFLLEKSQPAWIFVIGVAPALLVLWIRRAVPEPAEWVNARRAGSLNQPTPLDLFRAPLARRTWLILAVCGVSLSAHWTFMFWQQAHIRSLPEVRQLPPSGQNHAAVVALTWIMVGSIVGNTLAGALAKAWGYRRAIVAMLAAYGLAMAGAFGSPWSLGVTEAWFTLIGVCQGVFALFTMCLPPLFPTLLRTTGAGFCYNAGRVIAAGGTVYFGLYARVNDYRHALLYAGILFLPAMTAASGLPEPDDATEPTV
jgi:MFS family permease